MQTTLLGLAIALILALLAALVGPHFVDWKDHRAFFEAEASRLTGLNVSVNGPIKVGILPFPSVTLGDIEIGPSGQISRLRARSLAVELALGPLMRGELRAVETRLVGPQFSVGLNSLGRVDWPSMTLATETLAIDRLTVEDGRAVLTDAASNARLVLDKLWFRGQVRSLSGPLRGEGAFVSSDGVYGYRISAGRLGDDGVRVKLNVDDAERPLAVEADGTLAFDAGAPVFDGNLALSRPASSVRPGGQAIAHEPWRLTGKIKVNSQTALLEQVAFQYGPDDRAAKLDGAAEVKFGERPRLQAAMSARQIDFDRLIASLDAPRRLPASATQHVAELLNAMMRPPIPVSLTVSVDAVTLGGATLQAVGADLRSDGARWRLDKLDFRAPGFTKISASGQIEMKPEGMSFNGAASVDANDPKALVAWLAGNPAAVGQVQIKPWHARGEITLGGGRIGVEQLRTEFDRRTVEGRLTYTWPAGSRPARLDADLRADEIDFDGVFGFGESAFSGLGLEWPKDIALALEAGRARLAGFEARSVSTRLKFDATGIAVERLSVADLGNAAIQASGRIDTQPSAGGSITIDLDAKDTNGIVALADKFAPALAEPLERLAGGQKTARLRATVSLENEPAGKAAGKVAVSGLVGAVRVEATAAAIGKPGDFVASNLDALAATDARFEAKLEADDGKALLGLAGLDRLAEIDRLASSKTPARLTLNAAGRFNQELRLDGRLAAGVIDLAGKGMFRRGADNPPALDLDEVTGNIAGSKVKGRLVFKLGEAPRLDGAIETDMLDAPAVVAAAIGMRTTGPGGAWSAEPFVPSASDLAGRIEFKTQRAALTPGVEAKQLRGVVRFGPAELVFEDIESELAGGRIGSRLSFVSGDGGLSARARVELSGVEAPAVLSGGARHPSVTGRLTLRAELEGNGRSPAAFIGSLKGSGNVILEGSQISGLNPRVFDAVIRAVELGVSTDVNRIRDFVSTALDTASLPAARAEAAFSVEAGQLRLKDAVVRASGADLDVAANIDLADASLDAVLTLSGVAAQPGGLRPAISVALRGPLNAPKRTVDADSLASWLALRALEQQSKQIEAMERQQREAAVPPAEAPQPPAAPAVETPKPAIEPAKQPPPDANLPPPLPAPVNVGPAPKPRAVPRAENPAPAPPRATAPPRAAAPRPAAPAVGPPLDLLGAQR